MPWTEDRVKHLYRRAGHGATYAMVQEGLAMTPEELVDKLVDEAIAMPVVEDPGWGYADRTTLGANFPGFRSNFRVMQNWLYDNMRSDNLFGRMQMFWKNHFCTEYSASGGIIPYNFQQIVMWQTYGLGNFREFVRALGTDPQMLYYLNGFQNKAGEPNENYARELYELFTLGVDNGYTETDIEQTAIALTGYNSYESLWGKILFNENGTFDESDKTIFGQTGNWGHDDVIDILFEQKGRLVAENICRKFYRNFISAEVDETIIDGLATTFVDNDYEIAPVLRQLFKSEHFFNDDSIGSLIKSPMELIIQLQKELDIVSGNDESNSLNYRAWVIGFYLDMELFEPPNVAGWPGDEFWINSATISARFQRISHALIYRRDEGLDVYASFAQTLFPDVTTSADEVARGIVDFVLTSPLEFENEYEEAISTFKSGVPAVYFSDGTWDLNYVGLDVQVHNLMQYIIELPEYQLK